MARKKKAEFRPDKPRIGLMGHLQLTQNQKKSMLRWGLYALCLVLLSVIQDVIMSRIRVGGAATELVPCAIFLICIFEGSEQSCIFALVSSALYLFSGTAPGPYAMVAITAVSVLTTIFRQSYLQKGFFPTIFCVAAAMLLYELCVFGIGLFLGNTIWARFGGFLMTTLLTLPAIPLLYPLFYAICKLGGEVWKE